MDQLLFGWSEEGLEGFNRQQVIAASPGLSNRHGPLAQVALAQCYSPLASAFGWCESGKYRVAFRRTQLGLDGRGRPGNYLVHAVAGLPEELEAEVITSVASRLLDHLPVGIGKELPQVYTTNSLEPLPPELYDTAVNALAYYLDNLSRGRLTALSVDAISAATYAAFIASVMPAQLGLVGFSGCERPDVAERFDIVAQAPPTPLFSGVDLSSKPPRLAHYAAELLSAAAGGDQDASSCIALLVQDRSSRRDFVDALMNWVAIEHAEDGTLSDEALTWLAREPALRRRASGMPALREIVDMTVAGSVQAARVLGALHDDKSRKPQSMIADSLQNRSSCEDGFGALIDAGAYDLTRAVLAEMLSHGPLLSLEALAVRRHIELLKLFDGRSAQYRPVRAILECSGELAEAVVGRPEYRVDWQVFAARAHCSRLRWTNIAALMSMSPGSAKDLVARGAPTPLLDLIEESFSKIDTPLAVKSLVGLEGVASHHLQNSCWLALISRLGPADYYEVVTERRWSMIDAAGLATAFLSNVRNSLSAHLPIPSAISLVRALGRMSGGGDVWREIAGTLVRFEKFSARPLDVSVIGNLANRLEGSAGELVWLVTYGRILEESTFGRFASLVGAAREWHGDAGCASRLLSGVQFSIGPQAVEWLVRWVIVDSGADSQRDKKVIKVLDAELVRAAADRVRFIDEKNLYRLSSSRSVRRWVLAAVPQGRRGRWFKPGGALGDVQR